MKELLFTLLILQSIPSFAESTYSTHCSCQVVKDYIIKTQDYVSGSSVAPNILLGQTRSQYQIKKKCLKNLEMNSEDARKIKQVLLYNCSRPTLINQ